MKRSTIFLIIILVTMIIAPIVYIGLVAKDVIKFKDWVVEELNINNDDNSALSYKMRITSLDGSAVPECYMNITTYEGVVVDTLNSVNFVVPADGVTAILRNDSIIVVLDKVDATVFDGLCLTVEIPENSRLKIENSVSSVDIHFHDADLSAVKMASLSDLIVDDSNWGAFVSTDSTTEKGMRFLDSNVGAMKIAGENVALTIQESNMGALTISGTCRSIKLSGSNLGVCSWNRACDTMADIDDCVITTQINEGQVNVTIDDDIVTDTSDSISIKQGDEKVNISASGVKVNSEDGTNVDISPSGVHVESEEATVHITPAGLVVKEGDEEVVSIGLGGVKVNKK